MVAILIDCGVESGHGRVPHGAALGLMIVLGGVGGTAAVKRTGELRLARILGRNFAGQVGSVRLTL